VPETNRETALANTKLTERELLIHAVQHLEDLSEKVEKLLESAEEIRPAVLRLDHQLQVFAPLLARLSGRKKIFG
jgi:hypothetical protein